MSLGSALYRLFLDPLLIPLRKSVAGQISDRSSVLEIAFGTGHQARILAGRIDRYRGVELNRNRAASARRRFRRFDHLIFEQGDGRHLPDLTDQSFDFAVISLALHEMPGENRLPILLEMKRCAKTLILADYASPLPRNSSGGILHAVEFLAGGDHYAGFRSFQASGGLDALLEQAGLRAAGESRVFQGGIRIISAVQ